MPVLLLLILSFFVADNTREVSAVFPTVSASPLLTVERYARGPNTIAIQWNPLPGVQDYTVEWEGRHVYIAKRTITTSGSRVASGFLRYWIPDLRCGTLYRITVKGGGQSGGIVTNADLCKLTATFSPTNNAIVSDNTINITLAFGEAVRKAGGSSITNGDIKNIVTLQNSKGIGVDFTGSISGNTITLTPTNNLSDDTYTITLVADTVEDLKSALVPEKSATFTVDTTAPTVTFTPLDGTVTNNNTINITLAFDEPVRKADGSAITNAHTLVTLKKSGDDADLAASGTTTFNTNTTITINPAGNLPDGVYIVMVVDRMIEDMHNNALTIPQRATFTVDTTAPPIAGFALVNEASDGYINNSEKGSTSEVFSPLTSTRAGVVVSYAQSTASSAGTDACSSATFSYTFTTPPAINTLTTDGTYYFCAKAAVGTTLAYGNKRTVIRDTVAPTGTGMRAILSSDTGVTGDNITNDTTPDITLSGLTGKDATTARLNITFTHSNGTKRKVNNVVGNTTVTAPILQNGTWTVSALIHDIAGNSGLWISNLSFTVDITPPSIFYVTPASLAVDTKIITMSPTTKETHPKKTGGYTLKSGLPPGLSLDPDTGAISGTPSTVNTQTHTTTIVMTDAASNTGEYTITFPVVRAASPGVPQSFTATPGDGAVTLSWRAPTSNGGAAITKYQYTQKTGSGAYSTYVDIPGSNGATTSHIFTSLTNGVAYSFKICALSSAGCGTETAEQTATPQASIVTPSDTTAPTVTFFPRNNTTVTRNTINITLAFNEPVRHKDDTTITNTTAHTVVILKKSGNITDLATSANTTFTSNTITIDPDTNLTDGTYTVTLLADRVEDTNDNAIALSKRATFTVAAVTAHTSTTTTKTTRTRRGGGGGGSGSFPTLPTTTMFNTQSPPTPPPPTSRLGVTSSVSQPVFTRTLIRRSTGEDVRTLQKFLNENGYTVATTGPGSSGKETTTFGPATEKALKAFQTAHSLLPFGILDGPTRNFINLRISPISPALIREHLITLIRQIIQELTKRGISSTVSI